MTKAFVFAGNDTVGNMVADRLCGAGWQRVGDAGAADAVLTYFTTQTALEDAYFGDNGIVQGARKGTLLIDLSCTTPPSHASSTPWPALPTWSPSRRRSWSPT